MRFTYFVDMLKFEQRANIEYYFKFGKTVADIVWINVDSCLRRWRVIGNRCVLFVLNVPKMAYSYTEMNRLEDRRKKKKKKLWRNQKSCTERTNG